VTAAHTIAAAPIEARFHIFVTPLHWDEIEGASTFQGVSGWGSSRRPG
jgi:hypothetical protein